MGEGGGWEGSEWIGLVWVVGVVSVGVEDLVLVLGLVGSGIGVVELTGEGIWGDLGEVVFLGKDGVHSVLSEEPLESVDMAVHGVPDVLLPIF